MKGSYVGGEGTLKPNPCAESRAKPAAHRRAAPRHGDLAATCA